ncbi:MAG TPA: SigB/SigF/SigG family RNA polymerase sigma factor [Thermoleophilaceae bacterium]|jgi:RNA polymerase sigma-B factor
MALASDLARSSHVTRELTPASNRPPGSTRRANRTRPASARRLEEQLFRRYQNDGDLHARRELTERYLPLARSLARRYERRGESLDDLLQVASLGLVKAIDRFEPERGLSFSSYAVPTMLGELRRYFRDTGWALHVPREMQERVLKVNAAVERLSGELGRSPSPQQLAVELNLPVEEVLEAIAANAAYDTASLETPLRSGDEQSQTVAESLGETDARFELIEDRTSIGPALKALPERQRLILHLRFVEDLTQNEIAQRVGVSQMHVSRLIRRALEQIRVLAGEET